MQLFSVIEMNRQKKRTKSRPNARIPKLTENATNIHKMIYKDPRLTVNEIASTMNISELEVFGILIEAYQMRQFHSRWIPRLLTVDQKFERKRVCEELLNKFNRDRRTFLRRCVFVDEIWIYHKHPSSWNQTEAPPLKKSKTIQSSKKVRIVVFWDANS